MRRWEYQEERAGSEAIVVAVANSKSEDGWELVTVVLDPRPGLGSWVAFYKRLAVSTEQLKTPSPPRKRQLPPVASSEIPDFITSDGDGSHWLP